MQTRTGGGSPFRLTSLWRAEGAGRGDRTYPVLRTVGTRPGDDARVNRTFTSAPNVSCLVELDQLPRSRIVLVPVVHDERGAAGAHPVWHRDDGVADPARGLREFRALCVLAPVARIEQHAIPALALDHEDVEVAVAVDVAGGDVPAVVQTLGERGLAVPAVRVHEDLRVLPPDRDEVGSVITADIRELDRAVAPVDDSEAIVVGLERPTLVAEEQQALRLGAHREVDASVTVDVGRGRAEVPELVVHRVVGLLLEVIAAIDPEPVVTRVLDRGRRSDEEV